MLSEFASSLPQPSAEAIAALAPSGTLRAGINLSNFLLVSASGPDGEPVGVSPAMAGALAAKLGTQLELVAYANPGEVADAATSDEWDIGNIGADPARSEHIAFTAPYCEIECTYLVRGDSRFNALSDVDQPGVRVVTKARAAYGLWLERNLEHAELVQTDSIDASFDAFVSDELDVLAGLRPRLLGDAARLPGSRILDGRFTAVQQAIGVPRTRDAAGHHYLERFVAGAVECGFVSSLIEHHGVIGLSVAAG